MSASLTNEFGQPVGFPLPHWQPPPLPQRLVIEGKVCRLEPLETSRHAADLHAAQAAAPDDRSWTYLPYGPFADLATYQTWVDRSAAGSDPLFFAIVDPVTGKAAGVASYLRIQPDHGVIEVGHLNFSPALQGTRAATEAMYLLMRHAFELGYRRYEWKCDALNEPSRRAAARLGFTFEGIFRQAIVVKGRNRDTAWFSITDQDWSRLQPAFERWLAADNFNETGRQKTSLSVLTAAASHA